MLPALRNRNYRMWLIGLSVANIGTWMQRVAQDWLVLELTHRSGTALGLVTGLQFLPILIAGPLGGMVADRFPRRWVLLVTQVMVGCCGIALGAVALTGSAALWQVYLVAFVLGLTNAVFQPTIQAFVLELVTREEVPSVVGLSGGSFHASRLIGPAVAGVLINAVDTGPVFLLSALTVVSPIIALVRLDPTRLHVVVPAEHRGARMIVDGFRYALGRPDIRLMLGVTAFVGTFAANSQVTNALMATTVFGKGAGDFGLLGSVIAIGSLAGGLLAARRTTVSWRFATVAGLAFAALNVVSGLVPSFAAFAVVLVPTGFAQLTFLTAANSFLQLAASEEMRGRVMALFTMLTMGTTPIGAPLLGSIAEHHGARTALIAVNVVAVAGVLAVVGVSALARRRGRSTPVSHQEFLEAK